MGDLFAGKRLRALVKALGIYLQASVQYPGAVKPRPPPRKLPEQIKHTMLSTACIQRVRSWGAAKSNATRTNSTSRTPQTLPELAAMLRDPEGRLRCPFGIDWEHEPGRISRLDREHRIPFWLALIEMHGDGYRYGMGSDRSLPVVFDGFIECLRVKNNGTGASSARCFRAFDLCARRFGKGASHESYIQRQNRYPRPLDLHFQGIL